MTEKKSNFKLEPSEVAFAALREAVSNTLHHLHRPNCYMAKPPGESLQNGYQLLRSLDNTMQLVKQKPDPKLCDITGLADGIFGAAAILAGTSGISVQCHLPKERIYTILDPSMLTTAVFHLIDNGCKYNTGRSLSLSLEKSHDRVTFLVENGGGAADFHTVSKVLSGCPSDGASTGLAIVKKAARLHGGSLIFSGGGKRAGVFSAALSIPIISRKGLDLYQPPTDAEYLCDKYSPAYVILFSVCKNIYHIFE